MAGADPSIQHKLDILQQEVEGKNGEQAGTWRQLHALFTVYGDALQRHASALEEGWPRSNEAASMFLTHVDALVTPLQTQAQYSAGDNATAVDNIASSAKDARDSMHIAYTRSVQLGDQWDQLSAQAARVSVVK